MSTIETMRSAILERIDAGEKALDALSADGPGRVLQVVDSSLAPQGVDAAVRAEIASGIVDVLARVTAHGRKTLAFERRLAGLAAAPDDLRPVAERVQKVSTAARDLAPQLDGASLGATSTDSWSSSARYAAAVRSQRGALDAVPEAADTLERALVTMSQGVEQYYLTLTTLVTSTTLALLRLATTISTWETAVGGILGVSSSFVGIEDGLAAMHEDARANSEAVAAMLLSAAQALPEWPSARA